jgi:cytochrome c oxidase cbb3-type subunit III
LHRVNTALFLSLACGAAVLFAQQSPPPAPPPPHPAPAYWERPPADPAVVQRGKQIFSANCSFCHGSDARGGEGGPNLTRSQLVLDDQNGERIAVVVQNGRPEKGMPKFDLSTEEIAAIATYLHSIPIGNHAAATGIVDPLVGDAHAGELYFNGPGKCTTCHSVTGDLAGIGTRYTDPKQLEGAMLSGEKRNSPTNITRKTVTVTFHNGQTVTGTLYHVDDFNVVMIDTAGNFHSFARNSDEPKVEIKDPRQPHLDMLATWKDDDIHNVTAYLVTLK